MCLREKPKHFESILYAPFSSCSKAAEANSFMHVEKYSTSALCKAEKKEMKKDLKVETKEMKKTGKMDKKEMKVEKEAGDKK